MKKLIVLAILVLLPIITFIRFGGGQAAKSFSPYVDDKGTISLPKDYRVKWAHLGTYVVPDDKDAGFHDVYTQPGTVEAYKKDEEFPDGAVLVKEVRTIESAKMTAGRASWAAENAHWFVMIKDQKGRFPDNPNWGEGWGWALFYPKDPSKNASTHYKKDCIPCHIPAKVDDWVFIEGYPPLR